MSKLRIKKSNDNSTWCVETCKVSQNNKCSPFCTICESYFDHLTNNVEFTPRQNKYKRTEKERNRSGPKIITNQKRSRNIEKSQLEKQNINKKENDKPNSKDKNSNRSKDKTSSKNKVNNKSKDKTSLKDNCKSNSTEKITTNNVKDKTNSEDRNRSSSENKIRNHVNDKTNSRYKDNKNLENKHKANSKSENKTNSENKDKTNPSNKDKKNSKLKDNHRNKSCHTNSSKNTKHSRSSSSLSKPRHKSSVNSISTQTMDIKPIVDEEKTEDTTRSEHNPPLSLTNPMQWGLPPGIQITFHNHASDYNYLSDPSCSTWGETLSNRTQPQNTNVRDLKNNGNNDGQSQTVVISDNSPESSEPPAKRQKENSQPAQTTNTTDKSRAIVTQTALTMPDPNAAANGQTLRNYRNLEDSAQWTAFYLSTDSGRNENRAWYEPHRLCNAPNIQAHLQNKYQQELQSHSRGTNPNVAPAATELDPDRYWAHSSAFTQYAPPPYPVQPIRPPPTPTTYAYHDTTNRTTRTTLRAMHPMPPFGMEQYATLHEQARAHAMSNKQHNTVQQNMMMPPPAKRGRLRRSTTSTVTSATASQSTTEARTQHTPSNNARFYNPSADLPYLQAANTNTVGGNSQRLTQQEALNLQIRRAGTSRPINDPRRYLKPPSNK